MLAIFYGIFNVIRYMPNESILFDVSGVGKRPGYIGDIIFPLLSPGAFLIIIGSMISIIFNLIASFTNEENKKIKYDIRSIMVLFFVIFSIIFGSFFAIITG